MYGKHIKGLPRSGTPSRGNDDGYMVCDYQFPTKAIGQGLRSLQQRGHCLFALLVEIVEHANGDTRRKWLEVEPLVRDRQGLGSSLSCLAKPV